MKKFITVLLALMLLLGTGCQEQTPVQTQAPAPTEAPTEAPTQAPTEAPTQAPTEATEPVPALNKGFALVDGTPAILDTLLRGDTVDVAGMYDEDHYVIKTQLGYGLVKKELLRPDGTAPYEVWTGYAHKKAGVYGNFYLTGEPTLQLKENTEVEVMDDLGYCLVVRTQDITGFMDKEQVSRKRISSDKDSTGADGGDISLQGDITLLSVIAHAGDVTGQATVLADGAEVVLGYFSRGEEIPLVAEAGFAEDREGYLTVYINGLYAYVPQGLVRQEGAEAYEEWEGYSQRNGGVYDNFYLLGEPLDKLSTNKRVRVLEELETCYLVEVGETTGYMRKDMVSKSKIETNTEEWSPPAL